MDADVLDGETVGRLRLPRDLSAGTADAARPPQGLC